MSNPSVELPDSSSIAVLLTGPRGTGKSELVNKLSSRIGWSIFNPPKIVTDYKRDNNLARISRSSRHDRISKELVSSKRRSALETGEPLLFDGNGEAGWDATKLDLRHYRYNPFLMCIVLSPKKLEAVREEAGKTDFMDCGHQSLKYSGIMGTFKRDVAPGFMLVLDDNNYDDRLEAAATALQVVVNRLAPVEITPDIE